MVTACSNHVRQKISYKRIFFALTTLCALEVLLTAVSSRSIAASKVYIASDDASDLMWTADVATYDRTYKNVLDWLISTNNKMAIEAYWLYSYMKTSPNKFDDLVDDIKDGHISVARNMLTLLYGAMPTEAVLRGMYYSGKVERQYGIDFPYVVPQENAGLPYGVTSLFAGSGVKYGWKGVCNCATKISDLDNREHEMYWWTGPDNRRVLMKWNSYHNSNASMGGYAEARELEESYKYVTSDLTFQSKYPYDIVGIFGYGWDDLETTDTPIPSFARSHNAIVSNEMDFFKDFEANYGAQLPSESLSYGNEWDLYVASMPELSANVKRSIEKLRTAEALSTLVSLHDTSFMKSRQAAAEQAWVNLALYWEHAWTADSESISRDARASWERQVANGFISYVDTLTNDAATALAGMIPAAPKKRFYVFNPLSWTRTDYADVSYSGAPAKVIDLTTGAEVPSQIATIAGTNYLRIMASDVPSVGYKVYEIQTGASTISRTVAASGIGIENELYKVNANTTGAITSIIDKSGGNREYIQSSANSLSGASTGDVSLENAGPVSATLLIKAGGSPAHETRVTLYRGVARIDIQNDINENFGGTPSWEFEFNIANPEVMHEEVGAIIKAKKASQGGQYADRNMRYDWLTLNHFADMSGGGVGITLSNADLLFMKLGDSSVSSLDTITPKISVLAGGQVDGSSLGIPNQGGDTHFLQRFALQPHNGPFSSVDAMKFSLEHQNPMIARMVSGSAASPYPATNFSLVRIDNPSVVVWAVKPSEDGIANGVITRLWNTNIASSENVRVNYAGVTLAGAKKTTHVETDAENVTVSGNGIRDTLNRQQVQTYRLLTTAGAASAGTDTTGRKDQH